MHAEALAKGKKCHVVDCDLKAFFDTVDHQKLIVNETKSKVVPQQEASFLGFQIIQRIIRWSEKSQKKFKAEIRRLTQRTRRRNLLKLGIAREEVHKAK